MGTILVIGATGNVGSRLVPVLQQVGEKVRAATREPSRFEQVEAVKFDYASPETFGDALVDVDRLFLMAPDRSDMVEPVKAFVDCAARANVKRIVAMTAVGVETDDDFPLRKMELHIQASGIDFTFLRPNWFMQNFTQGFFAKSVRGGGLSLPAENALVSFVDVNDIAAVAEKALREQGHAGKAYTVTGAQTMDHHQVAAALSEALGRKIVYQSISEEATREGMESDGASAEEIDYTVEIFRYVRQGIYEPISEDVQKVLGKPPTTFKEFARRECYRVK